MRFLSTLACLSGGATVAFAQITSAQWDAAYTKAEAAVAKMSQQDKVSLMTGEAIIGTTCTGNIQSISSINFPGLCLQDSALGVRNVNNNSAFPAGINAAATFNRDLINQRGVAMAQEFRGKGINIQLGPFMNLMRTPESGRNWEGFGGDPYLSGEGAFQTIVGAQSQGVQNVMKHFINNEQEHLRMLESSNVDDRTTHELYLLPFIQSVRAGVTATMCSYNKVNETFACQNNGTLNGFLKNELGFRGFVMSDWLATHSTVDSANNGLDMEMPGFAGDVIAFFGESLLLANSLGEVSNARLNDMATRILAAWYVVGQDSGYPSVNLNNPDQADHATLIRNIGAASTVLLKNNGGVLPLKAPRSIALIGSDAGPNPNGPNSCTDRTCDSGILAMGWGSGTANFPYLITPLDAITSRASQDGTIVNSSLSDTDLKTAAAAATGKDVAFVFITADSGEGGNIVEGNEGDRNDLNAWHSGNALVQAVAAVNPNTVVVVNSVGAIIMEPWIDNPNVTGLVWSGLAGQEAGNSLADVLYGVYNPSARLPYTIAKSPSDYSAHSTLSLDINYTEGLFIDYRHFDQAGITPRYEFGFGLSYTNFTYSDLSISGAVGTYSPPTGFGSSIDPSLHQDVFNVTFTLTNSGGVDGTEIPQLYLSRPSSTNSPPFELKGFDSVSLSAGASTSVTMQLSRFDLSIWDVPSQRWVIPSGTTGVTIGASSRDHRLTGSLNL